MATAPGDHVLWFAFHDKIINYHRILLKILQLINHLCVIFPSKFVFITFISIDFIASGDEFFDNHSYIKYVFDRNHRFSHSQEFSLLQPLLRMSNEYRCPKCVNEIVYSLLFYHCTHIRYGTRLISDTVKNTINRYIKLNKVWMLRKKITKEMYSIQQ